MVPVQIIAASICPPLICTRFVRFRVPDMDSRRAIGSCKRKEREALNRQSSAIDNPRRNVPVGCGGGGCCGASSSSGCAFLNIQCTSSFPKNMSILEYCTISISLVHVYCLFETQADVVLQAPPHVLLLSQSDFHNTPRKSAIKCLRSICFELHSHGAQKYLVSG